jgi:LPS O-antigen subunit length determinant protein (WzzB/FepE family)
METNSTDELSLRDVAAVLKRYRGLIVTLPIAVALLTLVITLLLPKSYSSRAIYNFSVATGLPNAVGLAQAYTDQLNTAAVAANLGVEQPTDVFQSKFDEKKGLWTLTAKGGSPLEAQRLAQRLTGHLKTYLDKLRFDIATQMQSSALSVTRVSLRDAKEQLQRLEPLLKSSSQVVENSPVVAAALEGQQGVGAQAARSSNVTAVSLALQINSFRLNVATLESKLVAIQKLLGSSEELKNSIGEQISLQVIAPPGQPLEADFPRPMLFTALAAVLGLLIALIAAFILEALREPRSQFNAQSVLVSAD